MVIGVDARATVRSAAGRGRVVSELVGQFGQLSREHDGLSFRLYSEAAPVAPESEAGLHWKAIALPEPLWHRATARDANDCADVFLSTNSYLTPLLLEVPTVTVIHDLIPMIPEAEPRLRSRVIEALTLPRAVRSSDALITTSRATADDLARRFPAAEPKTVVAPLAASTVFTDRKSVRESQEIRRKYGLDRQFILLAGTLEPRKNIPRLIQAYARLGTGLRADYLLAVVGKAGWQSRAIRKSLDTARGNVRSLGHVPDEDLAALYRNCAVFCFTSLYEGFGLPPLEAMQCGAPVLTSAVSSLPEVGGDAALYVDPRSVDEIQAGLERLLTDAQLRATLSKRGIERASRLSWDRTARTVVDCCLRVAAPGMPPQNAPTALRQRSAGLFRRAG